MSAAIRSLANKHALKSSKDISPQLQSLDAASREDITQCNDGWDTDTGNVMENSLI